MTFALFEIPLQPAAQTFRVSLAGVTYTMTIVWRNDALAGWVLDIADAQAVPIVQGIPLVTGADLLAQYAYLGIAGKLIVQSDGSNLAPTYASLGATSHLYFVPN